jgi:NAD(P)-dependent dehydrogenase (short-subunit alcohol dehydrogenase family)
MQDCHNQTECCSCPRDLDLSGTVALVTGGNASIGLETARGLLQRGARVIIAARSSQKAEAAVAELKQSGGSAVSYVYLDLSDLATVKLCLQSLSHLLGNQRITLEVENAGVSGGRGEQSAQ